MKVFQEQVGEWAQQTFRQSTPRTITTHLLREAIEAWLEAHDQGATRDQIIDTLGEEVVRACMKYERGNSDGVPSPLGRNYGDSFNLREESADIFLLLLHLAHREGFSLHDEAMKKFAINRERQWGQPDAEGVVEHVRK